MNISKPELISKLTGVYQFLCRMEELTEEKLRYKYDLENAESALSKRKNGKKGSIIRAMLFLGIVIAILLYTGGNMGLLLFIAGCISLLVGVVSLINTFISIFSIPKLTMIVERNQQLFDEMESKFNKLFADMPNELADANQLSRGDYYLNSRYVKYGIDSLNSGRVDTFKEVMSLIDEIEHREKIEAEAEKQTRFTQEAAKNTEEALIAARNAEKAAKHAAAQAAIAKKEASSAKWNTMINKE